MSIQLSELVKKSRIKKNLSQRELARLIDVDNATISKIENGSVKKPTIEVLLKLSNQLDINFFNLINQLGYNVEELFKLVIGTQYNEENLIELIGEERLRKYISEKDRRKYIDIIKVLHGYKDTELDEIETINLLYKCTPIELDEQVIYESEYGDITIEL